MKKLFIRILLAFGIFTYSYSQSKGKIEFGIGFGYNTYAVRSDLMQSESGSGINFSGSAEYYLSETWGIKSKLIYDSKGWDRGFVNYEAIYYTDYKLKYLTVPVMANWHFGRKKNWNFHFGPYVGFLLSAKETEMDRNVKGDFNSTDFGFALGLGLKIPVSHNLKLLFELDGQGGFSNIFKESDDSVRNTRSAFNVGLNYTLK